MTFSRFASAAALAAAFAAPASAQAPDPYVADFIDRARAALDADAAGETTSPDAFRPALLGAAPLAELPLALTTVETMTADAPAVAGLATLVATPVAEPTPAIPDDEEPAVVADATPTFEARVVEEPSVVEDPVQFRRGAPPVRMELLQTRRRVVLLPGVGEREARLAPSTRPTAAPADAGSRVVTSRAAVLIGEEGQREVVYLSARPAALDLGAETGCGDGALETGRRLRGTRVTSLRLGMRGEAVRAAQTLLCLAGHDAGDDGIFDDEVDAAVRAFQQAYTASGQGRLAVDGALGPRTRRALDATVQARHGG